MKVIASKNSKAEEKSMFMVDFKEQTCLMNRIQERTTLCNQRKTALVKLIEEGFGGRMWTFNTAPAPDTDPAPVPAPNPAPIPAPVPAPVSAPAICIIQ